MTNSLVIPCYQAGTNIKSIAPLDSSGRQQLKDIGIDYIVAPSQMRSVHVLILNRVYEGIGVENKNGGLEFYSHQLISDLSTMKTSYCLNTVQKQQQDYLRSFKTMRRSARKAAKEAQQKKADNELSAESLFTVHIPQTVTFNEPGVLFFPYKRNEKSSSCCVFASLIDYLSYETLLKDGTDISLPTNCDCIVVNNVRNFPDALLDCEDYQRIYCLFPNTDTGRVMAYTIRHRNKGRYVDASKLYSTHIDLHDFMMNQKNTNTTYEQ